MRELEPPSQRPLPRTPHAWTWRDTAWWRIYHRGEHTPTGVQFRQFGPLHRFDHHTPASPPADDPDGRAVLYLGETLVTSACEVFGEAMTAQLCPNLRVAQVVPTRPIRVFDLHAEKAAMSIGALPALATGNEKRELTQQWARALFEDQPVDGGVIEGIHYDTAYSQGRSLALWDCATAVAVDHGRDKMPLDRSLRDSRILEQLYADLPSLGITVTTVTAEKCGQCQRG